MCRQLILFFGGLKKHVKKPEATVEESRAKTTVSGPAVYHF
jgi:hypothetical protein